VIALYGLLSGLLALLCAPVALVAAAVSPRLRRGLGERLRPLERGPGPAVWVHAASVGEAEAAVPLLEALLEREMPVLATTLTTSGRDRLRARLPALRARLAPLDLPGLAHASVRRAGVRVLALIETEIWPNAIAACTASGGRVVILGGRLSDRSFPRYRRVRPFRRALLRRVTRVGARSAEDLDRFLALGLPEERASLLGDLKLDRPAAPPPGEALRAAVGPGPLLLGASTHPGEEEALLAAWRELRAGGAPGLRLVLAPRHPERAGEVTEAARRSGARIGLRSRGAGGCEVVVLDGLGELASLYGLAELVFSGGTLAPVGGHNLIEPVQAGRVVVHGPHTENQRAQVSLLAPLGVLHAVADAKGLAPELGRLWRDPQRNAPALAAREALEAHRGASARALEIVLEALDA
jgi:3-deoxy-D-manno-octulosonic-acid transferase